MVLLVVVIVIEVFGKSAKRIFFRKETSSYHRYTPPPYVSLLSSFCNDPDANLRGVYRCRLLYAVVDGYTIGDFVTLGTFLHCLCTVPSLF